MKLAIIGSGNVGKALAGNAVRAGHAVTVAASHPENAQAAAQASGAQAAGSNAEAVGAADVVILAMPSRTRAIGSPPASIGRKPIDFASSATVARASASSPARKVSTG